MPSETFSNTRQLTQSSVPSSSVITLKRGSDLGGGAHDTIVNIRSASPAEGALIAARALKASAGQPRVRRTSNTNDPTEVNLTTSEGLANLDRWSQSTVSSMNTPEKARKKRSSRQTGSPSSSPRIPQEDRHPSPSRFRPPSAGGRLDEYRPGSVRSKGPSASSSRNATPRLGTGSLPKFKLSDVSNQPHVRSPLSPPVMRATTPNANGRLTPAGAYDSADYFGLGIAASRGGAAPASPGAHARYSSRRTREGTPEHRTPTESPNPDRRRSHTREKREKDKKTMLSKALEKANTAVLLDNAQNFEGALHAYNDACRLLQQVMDRTGGDEDKRKLDAIVSAL